MNPKGEISTGILGLNIINHLTIFVSIPCMTKCIFYCPSFTRLDVRHLIPRTFDIGLKYWPSGIEVLDTILTL